MSDFEKEKPDVSEIVNSFEDYLAGKVDIDDFDWFMSEIGRRYSDEKDKEITRLRAEIERKDKALQYVYDSAGIDWLSGDDDFELVQEAVYTLNPPAKDGISKEESDENRV